MTFKTGDNSISEEFSWVGDWSGRRAMLTPNREAILDNIGKKSYSYKDLDFRANQLARVLKNNGISRGDRVAMFSSNRIECIDLFLATGKIGAILVPFNIRLSLKELDYLIRKTNPLIFFYEPKLETQVKEIKDKDLVHKYIVMGEESILNDPASLTLMQKVTGASIERTNTGR